MKRIIFIFLLLFCLTANAAVENYLHQSVYSVRNDFPDLHFYANNGEFDVYMSLNGNSVFGFKNGYVVNEQHVLEGSNDELKSYYNSLIDYYVNKRPKDSIRGEGNTILFLFDNFYVQISYVPYKETSLLISLY